MKDVSKFYSSLKPKQAAAIAWGLSHDSSAAARVHASVPHSWRWMPDIEYGMTLVWLQAVAQFWLVVHLKLLNQHALAGGAVGFADSGEALLESTARLMECEARLLASDAALDSFAALHGFDPLVIRDQAQLDRFVAITPDARLDADYFALLMEGFAELDR